MAAIQFPQLTGRVVDNADMLNAKEERHITDLLAAHEKATTNQVVVVTLPDLGGNDIENYGYQLGNHWGIGQKGVDNGVLLIVAKKERKLRIEVGLGLEDTLTDAICANIINAIIVPKFKRGKFDDGIDDGVTAIIDALGGQYRMKQVHPKVSPTEESIIMFILMSLLGLVYRFAPSSSPYSLRPKQPGRYYHWHDSWYGGGHGGGFGGGFSGGGGGFGGGGASGGW